MLKIWVENLRRKNQEHTLDLHTLKNCEVEIIVQIEEKNESLIIELISIKIWIDNW